MVPLQHQKIQQKTDLETEDDNMYVMASCFMGVIVGMLVMGILSKSRIFYHLNTFDWFDGLNNPFKQEKLKWML